jgi:hypothetical protein
MAYDLHIERSNDRSNSASITLQEWRAAIDATDGVRLFAAFVHTIKNPKTGAVITVPARDGDAEVFFPDENEWRLIFRWNGDHADFAARCKPGDFLDPIWRAAAGLATCLQASIRGDDGESYDLS